LLPNTFIIGAGKCGTTSLWLYLNRHPDIAFSINKEPAYFVRDDYRDDLDWYESLFESAAVVGEASTLYTAYPVYREVPERIHSLVPSPKLIYMVRDPVERAISHYVEHVSQGIESRPAADALCDPDEGRNEYIAMSRYAEQVKQYLRVFPESSMLIFDQVELRDDPHRTLERVFRFLGVDPGVYPPEFETEVRKSEDRRQFTGIGARLRQSRLADRALKLIWKLPAPVAIRVVGALKRPVSVPIERPVLDPRVEEELRGRFAPEAEWLRRHTGSEFAYWSC
jgi:hypothetical protein